MPFHLYDVPGCDEPLRLSEAHAAEIDATLYGVTAGEAEPKPGTRAALVWEAEELGLSTEGTKAELEARIAEAKGA